MNVGIGSEASQPPCYFTGAGPEVGGSCQLVQRWRGKFPNDFWKLFINLVYSEVTLSFRKVAKAKQRPLLTDIIYLIWIGLEHNQYVSQATAYMVFDVI